MDKALPPHVVHAMASDQKEVYQQWINQILQAGDAPMLDDILMQLWNTPDPGGSVGIRSHILNTLMSAPNPPPQELLAVLEKHATLLLPCTDNPKWLSWIEIPIQKNTSESMLYECFKSLISNNQWNTFGAVWDIACSIPAHLRSLNNKADDALFGILVQRAAQYPDIFKRLHPFLEKSLDPEVVHHHVKRATHYAFEGSNVATLQYVLDKGLPTSDIDEIASKNLDFSYSSRLAAIGSFEWMWSTRQEISWKSMEHGPLSTLFSNIMQQQLAHTSFQPSGLKGNHFDHALNLLDQILRTSLSDDIDLMCATITSLAHQNRWNGIDWMLHVLDVRAARQVIDALDMDPDISPLLNDHATWTQHPRVCRLRLDRAVATPSTLVSRPKKI